MKQITVDTVKGYRKEIVYDLNDIDILKEYANTPTVRRGKKSKYLNVAAAFDIETTNIIDPERPYAFMYQWQFCIDDKVFFGRTWNQYIHFTKRLAEVLQLGDRLLVVYVHNLAFEFQFMRRFFEWSDVFMKSPRHPLKCVADGCIEYRDSYALSNMSLRKFCENTPNSVYWKNSDKFDYSKIRTSKTKLTWREESYCYCDVRGLCENISYLMQTDNLADIPLTSTGYVRRDFRHEYQKNPDLRYNWLRYRLTPETYTICRKAFRGGDTHASYWFSGDIVKNVYSYDISSSYPAAMLFDKFPVTKFTEIKPQTYIRKKCLPKFAALLFVVYKNIKYTGAACLPYIPIDKLQQCSKQRINDNGRLLECLPDKDGNDGFISLWLTDIDLKIIEHDYQYEKRYLKRVFISKYGDLPEEHKTQLMHYFRLKTQLKNVPGKEYEYTKAKNRLNSGYGMMVTDIVRPVLEYTDDYERPRYPDLNEALAEFYHSRSNFLRYDQGLWVTANARYRLRQMIWKIGKDCIYCDTDSIKCRGCHDDVINEYNREMIQRAEALGYYADDPGGKRHYLGTWETDGIYDVFKTLGSKRYIVKEKGSTKYKTTIAGVDKKAGARFFNKHGLKAFRNGATIKNAGHVVAWYNDDKIHYIEVDGVEIKTAANIALVNEDYTIGVTNEYEYLLKLILDRKKQIL